MIDLVQVEERDGNDLPFLLILPSVTLNQLHHFVEEGVQDMVRLLQFLLVEPNHSMSQQPDISDEADFLKLLFDFAGLPPKRIDLLVGRSKVFGS